MTSANPISPLPYADLPARWGIGVDRTPAALRVVVPPVPSVKDLPRGLLFGGTALAALVTFMVMIGLQERAMGGDATGFFVGAGVYGSVLGLVGLFAWVKLAQRVVIEISGATFTLRRVARGGRIISETSWPRHQIGGAKYNVSNGKMVVRIIGIDLLDVYVSPRREVTEWVARTVDDALRERE